MTRVYLLARVLQRLVDEVQICGFQFGAAIYPPPPPNLTVHAVPGNSYPQLLWSVGKLLRSIDGDVIYAVKPKPTSFGVGLLKKLVAHRPLFLDIDDWELSWLGGDEQHYRPGCKQLARDILKPNGALRQPDHLVYLRQMERLVARADGVTVNTQFLQARFGGNYLPNGKDTALFDPARFDPAASRRRYGLEGYRVLMFPGTVRPHKGLEDILLALDRLEQADLRLVMVGGRKPDNYEDQLLDRWQRWIIKLPRQPIEAMPDIVAAAHVVVVPQRDTPTARAQFPLKLTDGMAMAKPILTTRVGDIAAIVGEGAYLADPGSPEQLADCLQQIFQQPEEAQRRGAIARHRCLEYYSIDAMTRLLAQVFDRSLPWKPSDRRIPSPG